MANRTMLVSGIPVQIVRKPIENLHLGVYPPDGRVRVAVPLHVTDDNARLAVISRLPWIRKQQKGFRAQARQSQREMVTGETHYVWGTRYRLRVTERRGRHLVVIRGRTMHLYVNPGTTDENRRRVLTEWYRDMLKQRVPGLMEHWQPIIGRSADWGVQRMKTRWGSCNVALSRILLNLELAKKPPECLEYIVVHELVHLLERQHTQRFRQLMDHYLPQWERCRAVLNGQPLAEEEWQTGHA